MHNRSSALTRRGQAPPTPILLAPDDYWQFLIDYRQLVGMGGSPMPYLVVRPSCGEQFDA
jgi:hypothetical protein